MTQMAVDMDKLLSDIDSLSAELNSKLMLLRFLRGKQIRDEALKPAACEHGVKEGEWCPQCNVAYKQAIVDNEETPNA